MSFQQTSSEVAAERIIEIDSKEMTAFEYHIAQCCKSREWDLRKWLQKVLTRAGFVITEDKYRTDRCDKDDRYENVHNMLAIRGENPRICLVAHTDVCRDHDELRGFGGGMSTHSEYWHELYGKNAKDVNDLVELNKKRHEPKKVDPVIKIVMEDGAERRIIQDRNCDVQVGGDDRLGVAINTWIALNTQYPMACLFCSDEEVGLKSARAIQMDRLKEFDLLLETDRGNNSDQIVFKIGDEILVGYETAVRLLSIAYNMNDPRTPVNGAGTDVAAIKGSGKCKEAINLTVGYHNSVGASPNEYIDVAESRRAMKFVSNVIKDYYLNP
jgi:hypothetical protein